VLVFSLLLAAGGAAAAVVTRRVDSGGVPTAWVDSMRPSVRDPALAALLDRRAKAVLAKDKAAFMADVDQTDPAVTKRQGLLFDNLAKMPFAELRFELAVTHSYVHLLAESARDRYHQAAYAVGVAVSYKITGIDATVVSTPWVPVFGYSGGKWLVAGELDDKSLPFGVGGQPWDAAGPISVVRSKRVVAVISADDANRGPFILEMAETGLDEVAAVRSGGWDGKVLVTAVQDQRIFDRYFADSPDRVAQVAAIAVPYYDRIPNWNSQPKYATTRVVFNPQELSAQPDELAHDLTHEFAHAAMGPVTNGNTPRWLVEGFAEYVAYKPSRVSSSVIKRAIGDLSVDGGLPTDDAFYREPRNYVGAWLACKMTAERYGEAKLIALYERFQNAPSAEAAIREVLGVERPTLESQWRAYVENLRK
jgi:hypothetical protein